MIINYLKFLNPERGLFDIKGKFKKKTPGVPTKLYFLTGLWTETDNS